jgi:hypothetical protein
MAEEENEEQVEATDAEQQEEEEEKRGGGQKIMCFVSKEMVPINETVEVQYMPGKKVRVLPKYIRYETDEGEEATA